MLHGALPLGIQFHLKMFIHFIELIVPPLKNPAGLKCSCGKGRKGEKTNASCTETEPGQSKCSCFKLGQACSRLCRCKDCENPLNIKEKKFRPARKNRKACMCGNGRKVGWWNTFTPYSFLDKWNDLELDRVKWDALSIVISCRRVMVISSHVKTKILGNPSVLVCATMSGARVSVVAATVETSTTLAMTCPARGRRKRRAPSGQRRNVAAATHRWVLHLWTFLARDFGGAIVRASACQLWDRGVDSLVEWVRIAFSPN